MYYIKLYYTLLCYTMLYYTIRYFTTLYYTRMCYTILYGIIVCRGVSKNIRKSRKSQKTSILRRWYTQIPISRTHGNNKRPKIISGDVLGAEIAKFHQWKLDLSLTWPPTWDPKVVTSWAIERFLKWEFDTMILSMSPRARYIHGGSQIIKIISFKRLRGDLQGW